ncbi:MAG: ABC transporter substrate-binding protein [Acidimicrobiia bacterium]|nr:ABC transporter substrate-binding protein [Acidimicrobiia bacterium]
MTRLRVFLPFLFALALLGASCASDDTGTDTDTDTDTDSGVEAEATAGERRSETFVDDEGRELEIAVPVESVAVFNAFNVEFIRAVGAMDTVVGIDENAANVPAYWDGFAETIGAGQSEPNYERIAELSPELVIFPRNGAWEEAIEVLAPFDTQVMVITAWDQDQHEQNVSTYGRLFDRTEAADELNAWYRQWHDLLEDRLDGVEPLPVYLENESEFTSPIPGSGWHQMVELAGGENIFADIDITGQPESLGSVHAFSIEPEAIVARQPHLVVKLNGGQYDPPEPGELEELAAELRRRGGWSTLDAVDEGRMVVVSSFPMNASSKIVGSLYLASWLHPELFDDVDPDAVMTEWIERFQGVDFDEPERYYLVSSAADD